MAIRSRQTVSVTRESLFLSTSYEEPDGALESQIAEVFAQVLDLEKVGANDDFFDLGGDSLLAEIISMTISQRMGQAFQLSALLEYGSPRKIAALLEGTSNRAVISAYATREAIRPPIFIVHGRKGFTLLKPTFRAALADDQKLFMFELPGIRGGQCYERIEDIAAIYVAQLVEEHLHGPIFLAAFCMGSLIALEMAAQLDKIGRPVHQLVLIDPSLPFSNTWLRRSLGPRLHVSEALLCHLPHALFPVWDAGLRCLPRSLHNLRFRHVLERERREGDDNYSELRLSIDAQAKLLTAYLRYRPQTFQGAVTILLSSRWRVADVGGDLSPERRTPEHVKARVNRLLPQLQVQVFEGKHSDLSGSGAAAGLLQSIFDASFVKEPA